MDELMNLQNQAGSLRWQEDRLADSVARVTRELEEIMQEMQDAQSGSSGLSSALETLQSRTITQRDALAPRGSLSHILTKLTSSVQSETQTHINGAAEALQTARQKESELRDELERLQGELRSVRNQISDTEYKMARLEAEA